MNISVSRVLIVGINPSSARENHLSPTFRRVPKWADYLGLRNYSFINCIPYPGPYKEKDIDREFLYQAVSYHSKVIALGQFPSKILSKLGKKHFALPHPSGLNRLLNDKRYELAQLDKCSEYLKG